jgi:hypothetical protein
MMGGRRRLNRHKRENHSYRPHRCPKVSEPQETISILGTSMISVILTISFVGVVPSETFAQGTNATNATRRNNERASVMMMHDE